MELVERYPDELELYFRWRFRRSGGESHGVRPPPGKIGGGIPAVGGEGNGGKEIHGSHSVFCYRRFAQTLFL